MLATLISQGLLVLALVALAAAALRLASRAAARGLERALSAVVLGAAAAVLHALALGLVGLGASPFALTALAAATWIGAACLLPVPQVRPTTELAEWWAARGTAERAALGAAGGIGLAFAAFLLRYPAVPGDTLVYHLPEIIGWVHSGRPGSVLDVIDGLPVGNYPLTNEVLQCWAMAISRSYVPLSLWPPAMLALLVCATWLGLRVLGAPRPARVLAVIALCSLPLLIEQLSALGGTDMPALAWLVTCAALCAASRDHPALLGTALVAAGLAVGTKTTAAPLAVLALGVALALHRPQLRRMRLPLALALACAAAVGGTWYARNLIAHGSPLWPFLAAPWGDPVPPLVAEIDNTLLTRPRATLAGRLGQYADALAGAIPLLGSALLAPLLLRRRVVVGAASVVALSLLLWAGAPVTGLADEPLLDQSLTTLRYLLPTIAAALGVLALAARESRTATLVYAAFAAAIAWNLLLLDRQLEFPFAPSLDALILGAALGAGAALALPRLTRGVSSPPWGSRAAFLAAVAIVAMAAGATGYMERHARTKLLDGALAAWLTGQPAFHSDKRPIAMAPVVVGMLAGDRLTHPVRLIPPDERCPLIRRRVREGYVILYDTPLAPVLPRYTAARCLEGQRPVYTRDLFSVYSGAAPRPSVHR